jgi:hypothetical protein
MLALLITLTMATRGWSQVRGPIVDEPAAQGARTKAWGIDECSGRGNGDWLTPSISQPGSRPLPRFELRDDLVDAGQLFLSEDVSPLTWKNSYWVVRAQSAECDCRCAAHCRCCCVRDECRFKLSEFNIYPTFSYLGELSATYTEFEFASHTDLGCLEMENRTVLNVADLPSAISVGPTNPGEDPLTVGERASGFGDILSGFFFSRKGGHRHCHLGIGPVITFPTASDDILGARQWTIGPGTHFSAELGKLTAGFFLWQAWKVGGSSASKRVNQLVGKPFLIYELSEKWNLVYIPLSLSHSWEAKSGENWTVPVGGGIRRLFECGEHKLGFQFQAFDYVARKAQDPEWELRFTIEFLFDD